MGVFFTRNIQKKAFDMIKDILKRELIGQKISVIGSKNNSLVGISGEVIGETKNTLLVDDGKKKRILPKQDITIETEFEGKKIRLNARSIAKKPEDRIKSR
jgi:ribonuclease P protein subunit POP4